MLLEKDMTKNIGTVDRVIRILAGVALIAASLLGYIGAWGWLGIIPPPRGCFASAPPTCPSV